MVALFAITRGPYVLMGIVVTITKITFSVSMDTAAMWMFWTSCAINPIVYALRNPNVSKILNLQRSKYRRRTTKQLSERDVRPNLPPQRSNMADPYVISALSNHSNANTVTPERVPEVLVDDEYVASPDFISIDNVKSDCHTGRSDSIPSVLFFINQPRKGSAQSSATSCTTTTTL